MNKNDYLHFFLSFVFVLIITALVGYLSFYYIYSVSEKVLIESRIDANKQEAVHMARLLAQKLKNGYSEQQVIDEFQKSIQYTPIDKGFECMFNQQGIQLCHPNPQKIGKKIDSTNSVVNLMNNERFKENFENILKNGKPAGGVRTFLKKNFSEIIYVAPVEDSDLIVAVHANLVYIKKRLNEFREKLLYIFIISWLVVTLIIFVFIRFLYLNIESHLKVKKDIPKHGSFEKTISSDNNNAATEIKKRILAHQGNKLVPVLLEDIAYAYIEFKITYIVKHSGEKLTANLPLDDLFKQLDPHKFFRANRQFILSINAVSKVEKYGNSQLRVKVKPHIEKEIIISKLKMATFKKWLGR